MIICSGHDLGKSFSGTDLFTDLSFQVDQAAHIGLTGANGCGKTTLFKLITGNISVDTGKVVFSHGMKIGYMEQILSAKATATLVQAVESIFAPLFAMEERLNQINQLLLSQSSLQLIAEQHKLQEDYAALGGYTCRSRARSALLGLGFSEAELSLPVAALSGGQRSKALLARVLLTDSDLLLLDEPTNHLDIAAIEWLESFLSAYRGAFIVISHDRYFLDRVTNETWEFTHQRLISHKGSYTNHLAKREAEEEMIRRQYVNTQREIVRIEAMIAQQKRFNQAHNYVTIASKEKQLAKLREELIIPEQDESSLKFRFAEPPPGGNEVLSLHQVAKSFDGKPLFSGVDLEVRKGDRVFLLGANGCGKTTLLKIIRGLYQQDKGMVKPGININTGYYDQIQAPLVSRATILEELTNIFPRLTQTTIRTALGSFLFPGNAVQKITAELSGGERARLELLKLMLKPANFLLLDEPSNHLDIRSREAVEKALLDYQGTMLVVSHDRYLINKLATKIYYMDAHGLTLYDGNYDYYLEKKLFKAGINKTPLRQSVRQPQHAQQTDQQTASELSQKQEYLRRKEDQANRRKRENALAKLEQQIESAETELSRLNDLLSHPDIAHDYLKLTQLSQKIEQLQKDIEGYYEALAELI